MHITIRSAALTTVLTTALASDSGKQVNSRRRSSGAEFNHSLPLLSQRCPRAKIWADIRRKGNI